MTVCIGALFRWNYAKSGDMPDWGAAALTLSDRKITAGDVEYEPHQTKIARASDRVLLLIAGDYTAHSQAVKMTMERARNTPGIRPYDLAIAYGAAIQAVRRRLAEDAILAPLGLNTDSFVAQQQDMSDHFVSAVTDQLQSFQGPDVEAIVIGLDPLGAGHLYAVDSIGTARCYDDVGFTAIGIGGGHARLSLMQSRLTNTWNLAPVLAATFAAKKAAETAPGVGKTTDINVILRGGSFPLWPPIAEHLARLYDEFNRRARSLSRRAGAGELAHARGERHAHTGRHRHG